MSSHVMLRAKALLKRLTGKSDGAIMIMGTWMAMGLIGVTWYVIGLGDALVYRDHVQEAADSVAFSAAVVHAKGMNFIAAINLVMMMLVALFLLIRIFEDFLQMLIDTVVGSTDSKCALDVTGPGCCEAAYPPQSSSVGFAAWTGLEALGIPIPPRCTVAEPINNGHAAVEKTRKKYEELLGKVLPPLGEIEKATKNIVTPTGALLAGLWAGDKYGELGIPVSAAMVPMGQPISGDLGIGGLPLKENKLGVMCSHIAGDIVTWVIEQSYNIPVAGDIIKAAANTAPFSTVIDGIKNGFAGAVRNRYCAESEDPWGKEGYYTTLDVAQNGADQLQVWSFVRSQTTDLRANIVPMGTYSAPKTVAANDAHTYTAEAEYYLDCHNSWSSSSCNNGSFEDAMFQMDWKARLRRVHQPSWGADLAGEINNIINDKISSITDKYVQKPEGLKGYAQDQAVGYVLNKATAPVENGITNILSQALPGGYNSGTLH